MGDSKGSKYTCPNCELEQDKPGNCVRCGTHISSSQIEMHLATRRSGISLPVVLAALIGITVIILAVHFKDSLFKGGMGKAKKTGVVSKETIEVDPFAVVLEGSYLELDFLQNPFTSGNYKVSYARSSNGFTYYKCLGLAWKTDQTNLKSGLIL